jgi:hypothetical protein
MHINKDRMINIPSPENRGPDPRLIESLDEEIIFFVGDLDTDLMLFP